MIVVSVEDTIWATQFLVADATVTRSVSSPLCARSCRRSSPSRVSLYIRPAVVARKHWGGNTSWAGAADPAGAGEPAGHLCPAGWMPSRCWWCRNASRPRRGHRAGHSRPGVPQRPGHARHERVGRPTPVEEAGPPALPRYRVVAYALDGDTATVVMDATGVGPSCPRHDRRRQADRPAGQAGHGAVRAPRHPHCQQPPGC